MLDLLRIHLLFRIPSLLHIYRNGLKIPLIATSVNRATVKNEPIHIISQKLYQYMPCRILLLLIQCMLLLLICSLSIGFVRFSIHVIVNIIFFAHKNQRLALIFYSAQWLSCGLVTYILSQDWGTSGVCEIVDLI